MRIYVIVGLLFVLLACQMMDYSRLALTAIPPLASKAAETLTLDATVLSRWPDALNAPVDRKTIIIRPTATATVMADLYIQDASSPGLAATSEGEQRDSVIVVRVTPRETVDYQRPSDDILTMIAGLDPNPVIAMTQIAQTLMAPNPTQDADTTQAAHQAAEAATQWAATHAAVTQPPPTPTNSGG
jgi:hypothetical protein